MQITFWWQPVETHFEVFGWGLIESWELTKILFVLRGMIFLLSWLFLLFSWVLFFPKIWKYSWRLTPGSSKTSVTHPALRDRKRGAPRELPREWLTWCTQKSPIIKPITEISRKILVQPPKNCVNLFGDVQRLGRCLCIYKPEEDNLGCAKTRYSRRLFKNNQT